MRPSGKKHQGHATNLEETVDKNRCHYGLTVRADQLQRQPVSEGQSGTQGGAGRGNGLCCRLCLFRKRKPWPCRRKEHPSGQYWFIREACRWCRHRFCLYRNGNICFWRCPAGYKRKSCRYTGSKFQQFHVSFTRDKYVGCPNKDRCKAKLHKRVSSVTASIKAHERAK